MDFIESQALISINLYFFPLSVKIFSIEPNDITERYDHNHKPKQHRGHEHNHRPEHFHKLELNRRPEHLHRFVSCRRHEHCRRPEHYPIPNHHLLD